MQELSILTTEKDLTTQDVSQIGDFFNTYISGLKSKLEMQSVIENIDFSPATIGMLAEVINFGVQSFQEAKYIADFGALPLDIQKKFKAGKLVLQHSNKVAGNNTSFLVDPKNPGTIVANLTLKKVSFNPDTMDLSRNMMIQMQLKQINEKLDILDEKINYQIQKDRDHELVEPFFMARDYIRDAQVTKDEKERDKYLYSAMEYLKKVYHAAYEDLVTSSKFMGERTANPFFLKHKDIMNYMVFMCEDMYMLNKSLGLQLQIYSFQGKKEEEKAALIAYANGLYELSEKKVGAHEETVLGLLQDYYPYNKNNLDMWINYLNNIVELRNSITSIGVNSSVYLVCAEVA